MSHRIAVSVAARSLGINRAELNRKIANAGIAAFEGKVEVEDLRRIAPAFGLDEPEILERTRLIRENAKAFRHDPNNPPPSEDLAVQIRSLRVDLLMEKQRVDRYQKLVTALFHKLDGYLASDEAAQRQVALELNEWLAGMLGSARA